ncbi:hypothetical protein D9M71_827810 [compost metagenome]
MQLHEVKVIESVGTVSAANQRLAEGWTLIAVVGDREGARYVFGRGDAAPAKESVTLTAADLARANAGL